MGYVSIPCNFSCCQGAVNQIVCAETSKHKTPFLMGQTGHRSAKQCNMGHGTIHVFFGSHWANPGKKLQESGELS